MQFRSCQSNIFVVQARYVLCGPSETAVGVLLGPQRQSGNEETAKALGNLLSALSWQVLMVEVNFAGRG